MSTLYKNAILKADEIRDQLGLDIFEPINIFDSCIQLGLSVRFVDVNMEGIYVNIGGASPTILLSNQRPLPRRCFTCAHELGHHVFSHGFKLDALSDSSDRSGSNNTDELLVDSFAGSLLMPVAGLQAEFAKRNWSIKKASPVEFYTICSVFGTGYQTLISHCKTNRLIDEATANALSKLTPAKILKSLLPSGVDNSYFRIIDKHSQLPVIDIEVSNYIILPIGTTVEGGHLQQLQKTAFGICYQAIKPGIVHIAAIDENTGCFIRIQNLQYAGLAEYRHLENGID